MIEQLQERELEPVPRLLLTVEQAAESMAISRNSVYELIRSGELVSIRHGTRRLVSVEAIRRFIERREAEAGV